ncbi:unnamed protein product, partial [Ectocarpus fasciculatus]
GRGLSYSSSASVSALLGKVNNTPAASLGRRGVTSATPYRPRRVSPPVVRSPDPRELGRW